MDTNKPIPKLESLDKKSIVDFERAYEDYERDVETTNRGKSVQQRINTRSKSECLSTTLLKELLEDYVLENNVDEEDREDIDKDEVVQELFDKIKTRETFDEVRVKLEANLRESKITLDGTKDFQGATITFFSKLTEAIERSGLNAEEIYKDEVKFGSIVELLVKIDECIKPMGLRAWLRWLIEGDSRKKMLKSELKKILNEMIAHFSKMKIINNLVNQYGYGNSKRSEDTFKKPSESFKKPSKYGNGGKKRKLESSQSSQKDPNSQKPKPAFGGGKKNKDGGDGNQGVSGGSNESKKKPRFKPSCWGCQNPDHKLDKCPIVVDQDERQVIVEEKRKMRSNKSSLNYVTDSNNIQMHCRKTGNSPTSYNVELERIPVEVLLDEASDGSLVQSNWLNQFIRSNNLNLNIETLEEEIIILLADNKTEITTNSRVQMSISFDLYDKLHLRNRWFYITEAHIGNPIIGFPELHEIGVDAKSTLDRLKFSDDS